MDTENIQKRSQLVISRRRTSDEIKELNNKHEDAKPTISYVDKYENANRLNHILLENGFVPANRTPSSDEFIQKIHRNLSRINGLELSTSDIKRILTEIEEQTSVEGLFAFNFNNILENGIVIDGRNIRIIDTENYSNNEYSVHLDFNNGFYDVIYINGFPIAHIEISGSATAVNKTIENINESYNNLFSGIRKFIQLVIVSNGLETRYIINNNTRLNKLYAFGWTDKDNVQIWDLDKFARVFLTPEHLTDMTVKYTVRQHEVKKDKQGNIVSSNKFMVILRPYQVFAIKGILERIAQPENRNGYIWHTTGSGKTLTSWKCVQLASKLPWIDKVIFVVDRADLDSQTYEKFSFAQSSIDVTEDENTAKLFAGFANRNQKFLITTMHKLKILIEQTYVKPKYERVMYPYMNKNILFIMDECHRSQSGSMHQKIKDFFKNGIYIGLTGTPIFETNKTDKDTLLTKELFGTEIHSYMINHAIRDKNVLGFSVDYYNTLKEKDDFVVTDDEYVSKRAEIDLEEVLGSSERIEKIVDKIYEIHDSKTDNRRYSALLAVESIPSLVKYYNEFNRHNEMLEQAGRNNEVLKVSAIFTPTSHKSDLDTIISNYNYDFATDFSTLQEYRKDLMYNLNCHNENHVDINIVVNIFLTGFDSPMTNTLYVDKNLAYHTLLQAFSRTNRIESDRKPYGNVVCFRPLRDNVDSTIKLFSYEDDTEIIAISYIDAIKELIKAIDNVFTYISDRKDIIGSIMQEPAENQKEFIEGMKEVGKKLLQTRQTGKFRWPDIADRMNELEYSQLVEAVSKLKEKADNDKEKVSVLSGIDFCIELMENTIINVQYILELIRTLDLSNKYRMEASVQNIKDIINEADDEELKLKSELINKFLDKFVKAYGNLTTIELENLDLVQEFINWINSDGTDDSLDSYISRPVTVTQAQILLDDIPDNLIKPDMTFIDTCMLTPNLLYTLYKRLMRNKLMIKAFPKDKDRSNHILTKQLYGLARNETAASLTRLKLYKDENKVGNIAYSSEYDFMEHMDTLCNDLVEQFGLPDKYTVVMCKPIFNDTDNEKTVEEYAELAKKLSSGYIRILSPDE